MAEVAGAEGWTWTLHGPGVRAKSCSSRPVCCSVPSSRRRVQPPSMVNDPWPEPGLGRHVLPSRLPDDYGACAGRRIPYVVVGFPGCVAAPNGMNTAGLSIATSENYERPGSRCPDGAGRELHARTSRRSTESLITLSIRIACRPRTWSSRPATKRAVVFQMTASHPLQNSAMTA